MFLFDLKIANITPSLKNQGRQKKGCYRPVSLTTVIGKRLEAIIIVVLEEHSETIKAKG